MKLRTLFVTLAMTAVCSLAAAEDGVITVRSPFSVDETMQRLVNGVLARNLNIANRINHTAAAASVGLVMRPTQLLVFGSPTLGTPLMLCSQTMGIDLPLKGLVWQDEEGRVYLSYNDLKHIGKRHDITLNSCPALQQVMTRYETLMAETVDPAR
jgi:uncharacterized protein (DUF302 family)